MLLWDEATFASKMVGSPMRRLKLQRFQRNICVVLGNVGTVEDLPVLERIAVEADSMVAEHAIWAIEAINGRQ